MTADRLDQLTAALLAAYQRDGAVNDGDEAALPDRASANELCRRALALIFPGFFTAERVTREQLAAHTKQALHAFQTLLHSQVERALRFEHRIKGTGDPATVAQRAHDRIAACLDSLVAVRGLISTDVDAAYANDPAASNREVIVVSYPCIEALAVQRFAHQLYLHDVPLIPRMMTEVAHGRTGIDIHPGARIGESCFIDHGTGVVIGETTDIGKNCVLYQGVGLIAWNPLQRDEKGDLRRGQSNKRHPTLEDHVTVYAGASILGGDTVIGHHSVIGGSVWLTHSVEPHSVVTIKDPELNIRQRRTRG
jgi:serine O-acetyltransferase